MIRSLKPILFWSLLLCLAPALVLAQGGDCPDIVKTALAAASQACQNTGRNQACYGNVDMTAQPQDGVQNFTFAKVGDIVDVAAIQSLVLSPMEEAASKWGVALLRLQANIPDTLPGQNVTFLLFGDVQIINGVTGDSADKLRPMQAFYLRTGVQDSKCQQAPESGMLVQTPQGAGEVTFNVNGVDVQMGSTVFFQAEPKKEMTVSTLEGEAFITAKNKTQVIVPGTWAKVPLGGSEPDLSQPSGGGGSVSVPFVPPLALPGVLISEIEDLLPAGEPGDLRPYLNRVSMLDSLPLDLLERPIEIAPPLSDDEVQQINDRVDSGVLCGEDLLPACPTFHLPDGTECVLSLSTTDLLAPGESRPFCDGVTAPLSPDEPTVVPDATNLPNAESGSDVVVPTVEGDINSVVPELPTEAGSDAGDALPGG